MEVLAWVFLGLFAAGWTFVGLTRSTDDELMILATLMATLSWLLFAYFALSVTGHDSGVAYTDRYPAMAVWGVAMSVPNLYVALTGPLEIIADRSREIQQEVR